MKPSRLLIVSLIVTSTIISVSAQEEPSTLRGKFEFGIGINIFGPASHMNELMMEYEFYYDDWDWLFGGETEYPYYDPFGYSCQTSYCHYLGPRSQLGILLHYSRLRKIHGHRGGLYLNVLFSSVALVPLYTIDLGKSWEFQVGPALMFNTGHENILFDIEPGIVDKYTKVLPGFLSGMNLKIWDSTYFYGKISTQYLLTGRNKMGPFTPNEDYPDHYIPESKFGFSHLNFLFIFGFHLYSPRHTDNAISGE